MIFRTLADLLDRAEYDDACKEGVDWAHWIGDGDLEPVLWLAPLDYRVWCLRKGYEQFEQHCPWSELDGDHWVDLLLNQDERYVSRCDWSKLNASDWAELLERRPQFVDRYPGGLLDGEHWIRLLHEVDPENEVDAKLEALCDWEACIRDGDGYAWARLIQVRPDLAYRVPWDTFTDEDWFRIRRSVPSLLKYRPVEFT